MPETELLIDNYLEFGRISIDSEKITASNSIIYIPAKLYLRPITIKPLQHFNIDEIECSLLLNNSEISNSTIKSLTIIVGHSRDRDILCKFMIPDNNIKKIEDKRKGGNVELGLNLNFYLDLLPIQGSKIKGKKTSPTHLSLKIFRSQWEDTILPAFGYSQKKANSILFRTWGFLRKNWATILQLACGTWDVVKDFLK